MSRCFSTKIDPQLASKIEADLLERGFVISRPPHTLFAAKKEGVSCTLYQSGALTVQGRESASFVEFYLEPEILHQVSMSHPPPHIGLDEAGKGDFFGPLCVASLYADEAGMQQLRSLGVRDSKSFTDGALLKLAKRLRGEFVSTVIRLFPKKYNELYARFRNLNRLLSWAHVAALEHVVQKTGCKMALLDQFAEKSLVERELQRKNIDINLEQRHRGEEDLVVAAASILARAAFLEGLDELSQEVGMTLPKGAGTAVLIVGRKLVTQSGPEVLTQVAKLHFKTTQALKVDSSSGDGS